MIRRNQHILTQLIAVCDFLLLLFAFIIAWWVKFESGWLNHGEPLPFRTYLVWGMIYGAIALVLGFFLNFYVPKRKKRFSFEVIKILQIHFFSLLFLLSILFVYKEIHISRELIAIFVILAVGVQGMFRYTVKITTRHLRKKGFNKQFVLIIGAGSLGKRFSNNLEQYKELGYEVIGFLDDYSTDSEADGGSYKPIIGKLEDLEQVLSSELVDEVVIALPLTAHLKYGQIIATCEKMGVRTLIIPDFFDYLPARPYFDNFAGMPLINVRSIPLDDLGNRILKRGFDIAFSLAAIMITLPVMLLVAALVKLSSSGPVIFKQERVGYNRRNFFMYKFRTMKVMPETMSNTQWTVENDSRRTKLGEFLRRTSLDELPQFFNVLMGHMSVVGPRPERPFFVEQFKEEVPKYMVKHHIRPGITGLAQSKGLRGDTSISERVKEDIFYIENWTLLFDI
ncbi:MAG: undecaprenyl-phosphate glucose phosphotransferase, partial [Paenibacillus sp.]|nr:undecaprenyl-phosphate glucose phosphotransferase [Paenibacillus sp.]